MELRHGGAGLFAAMGGFRHVRDAGRLAGATGTGLRFTMVVGAGLFIIGMVLTATVNSLWQFYLYFGIILSAAQGHFPGAPDRPA